MMIRHAAILAVVCSLWTSSALAQVVVTSRPVVTTYYAPIVTPAPVVTYRVPVVAAAPITTYYVPAPVTTFYAPAPVTTLYAPTTTYYGGVAVVTPVATPVVAAPVALGRSAYGTVRAYVPGQPVRNTLRFLTP